MQASVVRYGSKAVRYNGRARRAQQFGDLPGQSDQQEWNRAMADADAALAAEQQAVLNAQYYDNTKQWSAGAKEWGIAAASAVAAAQALRSAEPGSVFPFGTAGNVAKVIGDQANAAEKRAAEHLKKRQEDLKRAGGGFRPVNLGPFLNGSSGRGVTGAGLDVADRPSDLVDSWASGGRLTGRGLPSSAFVGETPAQQGPAPDEPMSGAAKVAIGLATAGLVVGGLYYFMG